MGNNMNMNSFLFTVILFCSLHFLKCMGQFEIPYIEGEESTITSEEQPRPNNENAPRINPNTLRLPPLKPETPPSNNNPNTPRRPPSDDDSSDQSPPPPLQIPGLAIAKQYFYEFGYMTKSTYPFSNTLDTETIAAITTYQKFFNLDITGILDNPTLNQMYLPRCYVPDLKVTYDLNSKTGISWPQGIRWFPYGTNTNHLTYGFLPKNNVSLDFQSVFANAFNRWSEAIAELNLTKLIFTVTDYNTADIKIGFYNMSNTVANLVAGTTMRYQDGSYNGNGDKVVGDIHLDGSKYWVLPGYSGIWSSLNGEFYLETVAMHQIGHILGLSHSSNVESIMYPSISITNEVKVVVTADDKSNILNVYRQASSATISGPGGHYFTPFWFCLGIILLFY